jgi:TPP-dependent pyruvate/acetoin dehydrogenase alpha subunit
MARARARDPYLRLEGLLRAHGLADDAGIAGWREESDASVRVAIAAAEAAALPSPDSLRTDVFAATPGGPSP